MKKQNFAGFTVIELLVVMIIIGILATLAVVIFENHLKKGRDAFRKAEVNTIATLVKLDRLKKERSNYDLVKSEVGEILNKNSINVIEAESGKHYFYGYSAKKENFFVVVCGESDEFFVEGSPAGIMAVRSKNPADVCNGSSAPIKERTSVLDVNIFDTNLDAYVIYKLS